MKPFASPRPLELQPAVPWAQRPMSPEMPPGATSPRHGGGRPPAGPMETSSTWFVRTSVVAQKASMLRRNKWASQRRPHHSIRAQSAASELAAEWPHLRTPVNLALRTAPSRGLRLLPPLRSGAPRPMGISGSDGSRRMDFSRCPDRTMHIHSPHLDVARGTRRARDVEAEARVEAITGIWGAIASSLEAIDAIAF